MHVFVDLSHTQIGESFAFFDTVTDHFLEFHGNQTWATADDLIDDTKNYTVEYQQRLTRLIPEKYKRSDQ